MKNGRYASEFLEELDGPMTFGRFVLSLRTLYGYSQATLAKKLHALPTLIKDLEENRKLPSPTLIKKIAKLGGFPEEFVQKLVPNSKRRTKTSPSAKCIFREIGHSESESFSLRFRSKLIFNLNEILKDPILSKTYRIKKLDLKKQDFKNVSNGKISKLSLDTLLYMFCVLGGTIDLNPPKPLKLKELSRSMKKAHSQLSKKRVPKLAIKEALAESRKARSEDLTLGEMLATAMEEAVQIAENPNDFPKKFRVVKSFLPAPKVLLKSISAKPRKNNKKKFKQ